MFTLTDYVVALKKSLAQESDEQKRVSLIQNWIEVLRRHHRLIEGKKLLKIIETNWDKKEEACLVIGAKEEQKGLIEEAFADSRNEFRTESSKVDNLDNTETSFETGTSLPSKIRWKTDPRLIAGFRVIFQDRIIDNSVETQLKKIAQTIQK